jgi:hypothetical protein
MLDMTEAVSAVATRRMVAVGASGVLRDTYHAERQKNA